MFMLVGEVRPLPSQRAPPPAAQSSAGGRRIVVRFGLSLLLGLQGSHGLPPSGLGFRRAPFRRSLFLLSLLLLLFGRGVHVREGYLAGPLPLLSCRQVVVQAGHQAEERLPDIFHVLHLVCFLGLLHVPLQFARVLGAEVGRQRLEPLQELEVLGHVFQPELEARAARGEQSRAPGLQGAQVHSQVGEALEHGGAMRLGVARKSQLQRSAEQSRHAGPGLVPAAQAQVRHGLLHHGRGVLHRRSGPGQQLLRQAAVERH
mmetsp:Transcript_1012/g.2630  ORF Transcript_1012/g.2630 Transcript_1012/m.2630 type:complete len:259 (-) Transcript_1012:1026-1802(-)